MLSLSASVRRAFTAHDYRTHAADASTRRQSLQSPVVHDVLAALHLLGAHLLVVHLAAPLATVHLTTSRALLIALAGLGAGIVNGVAGGGTLVSFPVLLALGYPALTANVTNTVGIWPGYLGGVAGFRQEIGDQRTTVRALAPAAAVGAIVGAVLLLTTSPADFQRAAPWLILLASALFAVQPLLRRLLAGLGHDHPTRRVLLFGGTFVASVYGGYFGAAMGVMFMAILGLALPDTLSRTSGLRTILSVLVNGIAAVAFMIGASLAWAAVALLAVGSLIGGWIGARVARHLPAPVFRVVVIAIGLATALKLLVG